MTDPTLIEKLEQAEEGSRELSDEVLQAVGWELRARTVGNTGIVEWLDPSGKRWEAVARGPLPSPTESLDDCDKHVLPAEASIALYGRYANFPPRAIASHRGRSYGGVARNLKCAFVIVALKARAEG